MDHGKSNILVTGSHRSGTTWVGRTIAKHNKIRYIQEPYHLTHPNKYVGLNISNWFSHYPSSNQTEAASVKQALDCVFEVKTIAHATKICKAYDLNLLTPVKFSKHLLTELIYSPRILLKDPIALLSAGWLAEQYNLQVICMIRSPCAFVGSLKKANWQFNFNNFKNQKILMQTLLAPFAEEIEYSANNQIEFIDMACLLWNVLHYVILDYQSKYSHWLYLKYEDIAADPEQGFKAVFNYLELDMNKGVRDYINHSTSENNPKDANTQAYQPRNSKDSLANWKDRLSVDEVERVTRLTDKIASQFYTLK